MPTVFDIAAYITRRLGPVDHFRLNKLVYYTQAWSLVVRDRPAFSERIEAWVNGPVARDLWTDLRHHNGRRLQTPYAQPLSVEDASIVDKVLFHFSHLSANELIKLTHDEEPWCTARGDLPPTAPSENEITVESIRSYYKVKWGEAFEDNAAATEPPAKTCSIDDLAAMFQD